MKKIIKKVKGKKVLSFVLAAIMLATTFNIALPELKLNASAFDLPRDAEGNVVLDGITQKRVVSNYEATYATYANRFFGGDGKSEPTNFVIPGLSSANDYTPQGMTYWKAKDWILISAYDATGEGKHSVIYALDGKSTEFVALFKVLNADGSVNLSHGGGIAASEYNFYYADEGSKISYVPLSEMDVAPGTVKEIKLKGSIDCKGELNGVATSYCCYDEGVLWTGNFYISSDDRYSKKAYDTNPSVLMGYKLHGNSSAEEWHYLSTNYNVVKLNSTEQQTWNNGAGASMTYTTKYSSDYSDIEINGSITATGSLDEITADFASFTLTEGVKYKVEFISDNNLTDLYMFAPTGNHCNVKQAQTSKITQLSDGRYHYQMIFTAGLKPAGADSSWPATQSTDGTYTGTYTMRFDQDSINGNRNFKITDLSISKYVETSGFTSDSKYEGANCVGNPTYCVVFDSVIDCIQYAMVDNGRIYISRSWSRSESTNHVRQLVVGEIDLNSPGRETFAVNGITRACQYVDNSKMTKFGGGKNDASRTDMFYMGEALCVMEGYLYMFGESAAWTYNGKGDKCPEPIDVIWKIDQYAIMDELRETDSEKLSHYEPVTSLDQIKNTDNELQNTDEYIIVYESSQKDPVTQKNILYALDAFGGHDGKKLPKEGVNTKDYTYGVVGHPITEYNIQDGNLYLTNPEKDDLENIRWKFYGQNGSFDIQSTSLYYAKHKSLCLNGMETSMATTTTGKFTLDFTNRGTLLLHTGFQYLWCNDGNHGYDTTINNTYAASGFDFTEQPGTFHANATYKDSYGIIGKALPEEHMYLREFKLYKRVLDEYAEKEMSKVYTNSTATLQPDGTYTIDMETYAISPTHYRIFDEQRPTDFILVLDASASMENNKDTGMTGWKRYSSLNKLSIESVAGADATKKPGSAQIHGYEYSQGKIFYRTSDGAYRQIYAAVRTTDRGTFSCEQSYWAYYIDDTGYHVLHSNGVVDGGISYSQLQTNVQNNTSPSATISDNQNEDRKATTVFTGPHYEQATLTRLDVMRSSVESLIDKIAAEANATGMEYRVAVVQFGSTAAEQYYNTGMYKNDGSFVQYSGSNSISAENYASTFFDVTNATSLQKLKYQVIANIENAEGKDADTYSNHGYEMANNIISNYSGGYDATGDRSACILMITDGIPSTGKNATDKETVANEAIDQAWQAKEKGAYSYTVQMGDSSGDWSSMGTYIEALSSEYLQARSLTNLGDKNSDQIDYARSVPISGFNLDEFSEELFVHITANSRIGLAQLDADSIIRHVLGDGFIAPTQAEMEANLKFKTVPGYYDGLGRLAFRDSDASTAEYDWKYTEDKRTLTVSGYDYTTEYISKGRPETDLGRKLVVSITGILPDSTKKITSEDICDDFQTAIYQSDTQMNNTTEDNDLAFKHFPNESFSIPEYTYVLDYGLQMLDTDVNGTLCSVSDTLSKQSTYKNISENGAVAIQSGDQNLLYSLSPDKTEQSGYTLIKRDDGTYDWFKINIVPASNVYFEEDDMNVKATDASNTAKADWTDAGKDTNTYRPLAEEGDVVGFDNAYDVANATYSNGNALTTTVTASQRNSKTQTFDFVGTGIDIVSRCSSDTGILLVNIKNSAGKSIAASLVDTYCEAGTFNQTPVFNWSIDKAKGETYGTYTVEVSALYLSNAGALNAKSKSINKSNFIDTGLKMNTSASFDEDVLQAMLDEAGVEDVSAEDVDLVWFDDNSIFNGGTGVAPTKKGTRNTTTVTELVNYIDGFRVYNPLGTDPSVYTEENVSYANVIDNLAPVSSSDGSAINELFGIAFITGLGSDVTSVSFEEYKQSGPKGELYLNAGKAISFKIDRAENEKVMLGLRAVNGATTINVNGHAIDKGVNSATEMYYDISNCIENTGEDVIITVENTGSGLVAVNHIKFSGGDASNGTVITPRSLARSADATETTTNKFLPLTQEDLVAIETVMNAEPIPTVVKNGVVIPLAEEEEEVPEDNTNTDNDNTNDDTDTEESEDGDFGILSLIKMLIAFIEQILRNALGAGSIA